MKFFSIKAIFDNKDVYYASVIYGNLCLSRERISYFSDFEDLRAVIKNLRQQVRVSGKKIKFEIKSKKFKEIPKSSKFSVFTDLCFLAGLPEKKKNPETFHHKLIGKMFFVSL